MIRPCARAHPCRAPRSPRHSTQRAGFTLVEILLASVLASLVLAAVYTLFNVTLQQTQSTRDATEIEDVARGVSNTISKDLGCVLAPMAPKTGGNSAAGGGVATTTSSSTTGTTGTTGTTSSSSTTSTASAASTTSASSSTTSPSATDNATAVSASYAFEAGLIGHDSQSFMCIYTGRTPEIYGRYSNTNNQWRADQRQIIYWFVQGSGLWRRERPWVTDPDVNTNIDMDTTSPESVLLSPEVTAMTFEFSDGENWVTDWDGTIPGPDGVTPQGAPRAVRLTMTFQFPLGHGEPLTKTIQQVFAIHASPGLYTPEMQTPAVDGGSGSAITSGSSGGSGASMGGAGGAAGGKTGGSTGGGSTGVGT